MGSGLLGGARGTSYIMKCGQLALLWAGLFCLVTTYRVRYCPYCRYSVQRDPAQAVVELVPGAGDVNITGSLLLEQGPYGVFIKGEIIGLGSGLHGFHVHMTGDTGNYCKAAGGHFNPYEQQHSSPRSLSRHAGDLGNIITIEGSAITVVSLVDNVITLGDGGETDVANRAIVVHAGQDDLGLGRGDQAEESKKTGNAGARVACGIIKMVK